MTIISPDVPVDEILFCVLCWMLQGYGLFTIEDPKYTPDGHLLTRGPGNYKIPSCTNIPLEFNVTLLKDSTNPKAVYSSKVKLQATRTPVLL